MTKECEDCGVMYVPIFQNKGIPRKIQPDKPITSDMRLTVLSEYLHNALSRKKGYSKQVVQFIQQEIDMIPLWINISTRDLRRKKDA